jgi:hypothetical protein
MYVGGSCVDDVRCCGYTRVRCGAITWAHCTRVAALRTPEDSWHRSDYGRWLCVCSVHATVQEARIASACVCEGKECHRPGRLWPLPGDSVKCRQSNSARSGERSGGYYNQQGRKPLRHLGMSRGDGRQAFTHTFWLRSRFTEKGIREKPKLT